MILSDQDKTIALWLSQGSTAETICAHIGCTLEYLNEKLEHPEFNLYIAEMRKELAVASMISAEEQINKLAGITVAKLTGLLNSGSEMVQIKAASILLDRQLPKVQRNENINRTVIQIEPKTLELMMGSFAQAAGLKESDLIDLDNDGKMKLLKEKL